jgi:hypothetical protein
MLCRKRSVSTGGCEERRLSTFSAGAGGVVGGAGEGARRGVRRGRQMSSQTRIKPGCPGSIQKALNHPPS